VAVVVPRESVVPVQAQVPDLARRPPAALLLVPAQLPVVLLVPVQLPEEPKLFVRLQLPLARPALPPSRQWCSAGMARSTPP
jgi:hypothetical protein